jgi:hypothetical protein
MGRTQGKRFCFIWIDTWVLSICQLDDGRLQIRLSGFQAGLLSWAVTSSGTLASMAIETGSPFI